MPSSAGGIASPRPLQRARRTAVTAVAAAAAVTLLAPVLFLQAPPQHSPKIANASVTGSLFGVPDGAIARAVAAVCPGGAAAAATLAADAALASARDPLRALAVLENVSRACPGVSLPFAGRDLWRHVADAQLKLCCGIDLHKELHKCDDVRGRACVVFVQSHAGNAAARAVAIYRRRATTARFVFVSSSADDYCVPFSSYDAAGAGGTDPKAVARTPDAWALLQSPALLAWFTENPCVVHPKIHPLPLGPWLPMAVPPAARVAPEGAFASPHVDAGKALLLQAMAAVVAAGTRGRSDRLLVAVTVVTSSWNPPFKAHTGVRAQFVEHMEHVADAPAGRRPLIGATALATDGARRSAADAAAPLPPTSRHGPRGVSDYVAALAATRYAWAPPGRGMDTHRAWECLALGCIPVVLRSPLSGAYAGLSVLQVDSFANVTADALDADWAGRCHDPVGAALAPQLFAFWWLARIEAAARASPEPQALDAYGPWSASS